MLRLTDSEITFQAVPNQFEPSLATVAGIVQSNSRLENISNPPTTHRNLTLGKKVKLLHYQEKLRNATLVRSIFEVYRKMVMLHWLNREKIPDIVRRQYPEQVKRPLKDKHREIGNEVVQFIQFARHSRLLVTSGLIKSCLRKAAVNNNIRDFSAYNG